MKRNILTCAVLSAAMILIPLIMLKETKQVSAVNTVPTQTYDGYVSVMKSENGKVLEMDEREYLIGSLAAEADMNHHDEALKAQAVACRTYMLYQRNRNLSSELNGADISDNTTVHQGYLDAEARKKKWGDAFEENEKRAAEIVDSVSGKVIYYENKPILAVYHGLNNGRTKSALSVWKTSVPYLCEVESPGDKLSPQYETASRFTVEEFDSAVKEIDGVTLNRDEKRIGEVKKTKDGYVISVQVYGNTIASEDLRSCLGLKSCCFDVETGEDSVTFNCYGNGHMVGMSQYGADFMARQGSDYEEILTYYYSNVDIR